MGTADNGALSVTPEGARVRAGLWTRGGEDERMPVLEVGTGVGYLCTAEPKATSRACLLRGRGKPGEEERGSKAGKSAVAGRLAPAAMVVVVEGSIEGGGRLGSPASIVFTDVFSGVVMLGRQSREGITSLDSLVLWIFAQVPVGRKEKGKKGTKKAQCCERKLVAELRGYHGLQGYTRFASAGFALPVTRPVRSDLEPTQPKTSLFR